MRPGEIGEIGEIAALIKTAALIKKREQLCE
jgi:hypothetical protein